jgi:probable DNA metabolism protein
MDIRFSGTFEDWQMHARRALLANVPPAEIVWVDEDDPQPVLRGESAEGERSEPAGARTEAAANTLRVPKRFVSLARNVAAFRHPAKWKTLYSVLWRIVHENHNLLKIETDEEVIQLLRMEDAVSRDVHHVHAFVRFKKLIDETGERYVAWYKPDHKSIYLAAPFFAKRFASMRWSILTPDGAAHWDGKALSFSAGVQSPPVAGEDGLEELWCKYYATTFNPARTNLRMMRSEMPQRFWQHMPEIANLSQILARAPDRVHRMILQQKKMPGAAGFVPADASLPELRAAIHRCAGCELYKCATQAVFGEGPLDARIVFVGEQPGDQEDRAGRPFVGPAGEVLNKALQEVSIDRSAVYVTNAVKHFAFEERGKRRIHRTPRLSEVTACRPWMEAEMSAITPKIVVCLGSTAAKAVFGANFRLTEQRGKFHASRFAEKTLATYHPSAILRGDTPAAKEMLYGMLVQDLKIVAAESRNPRAQRNQVLPLIAKTDSHDSAL